MTACATVYGIGVIAQTRSLAGTADYRYSLTGVVVTEKQEVVRGATLIAISSSGHQVAVTDENGRFRFEGVTGVVKLSVSGKFITPNEQALTPDATRKDLTIVIGYQNPAAHENLVIIPAHSKVTNWA